MRRILLCALAVLLASAILGAQAFDGIRLSEPGWALGELPDDRRVTLSLGVTNESAARKRISVLSACPCLTVGEGQFYLGPGGKTSITVTFDPAGDDGKLNVLLVFLTDDPDSKGYLFPVTGTVVKAAQQWKR